MRLTTWLIVPFLATAFGQSGPPRTGAVEAHEINSLFLSHLDDESGLDFMEARYYSATNFEWQ